MNRANPAFRVKLATDLNTQKRVAIKILKVGKEALAFSSKEEALHCLHSEVNILDQCSELKISEVIKIKDCSFDGTMVKELIDESPSNSDEENSCRQVER